MSSPKKPMRLALLIPLDILLIASCSLSFSYFHHVRPQSLENDPAKLQQAFIPDGNQYGNVTTAPLSADGTDITTLISGMTSKTTAANGETTTGGTTDSEDVTGEETTGDSKSKGTDTSAAGGDSHTQQGGTDAHTTASKVNGTTQSAGTSKTTRTSTTTTTTTTTQLQPDLNGWGYKWPDVFRLDNEVEITENSYRSHDVCVNIETRNVGASVAYIADIYIRYIENFKSAFAQDTFGKNIVENQVAMAQRNNAILAVNGDYYGIRDTGVIVRNYTLFRNETKGELCGIYYDGTVTNYFKDGMDVETALQSGLYQTMTFGPYLIMDGVARTNIVSAVTEINPRTGFGYYEPGHYCFIVVDGRQDGYSVGMTLDEYTQLFAELGCVNAYNLDGGQSSEMIFNGNVYNRPYNGGRSTSDIFFIGER